MLMTTEEKDKAFIFVVDTSLKSFAICDGCFGRTTIFSVDSGEYYDERCIDVDVVQLKKNFLRAL
jgi:hypothetical protein